MEKIQAFMDQAYNRYDQDMSVQAFHDQLDAKERIAVFFGNLNYQVENGGYMQWIGNRYATEEVVGFLIRRLQEIATPEANVVMQHLANIRDLCEEHGWDSDRWEDYVWDNIETDHFDHSFYNVNKKLLQQVEEKFFQGG